MSLKKWLGLMGIFILAFVLVACGGDDAESNADGGNGNDDDGSSAEKYKVGILAPAVTHGWVP